MESCRNVSVSGGFFPPEQLKKLDVSHGAASFDDFFPGETEEESDVGLEWLSIFIEDSFSSNGVSILPPTNFQSSVPKASETHQKPSEQEQNLQTSVLGPSESHQKSCEREEVSGPCKTRATKRKRTRTISTLLGSGESYRHMQNLTASDSPESPLLPQTYWLADSELIAPKKAHEEGEEGEEAAHLITEIVPIVPKKEVKEGEEKEERGRYNGSKRCSHCLSQQTPQWRAGPMGPKTLCNACGVRYKSGRLFPEYRPAKSPTFVEYKHSNSHKIVMKMRMMANVT